MAINLEESVKKVKLDLSGLTQEQKTRAKELAGNILVDQINSFLDRSLTPVKGGRWTRKKADGSVSTLFQDGDMRSQITFQELEDEDAIMVGIFSDAPAVETAKSFNHNTGDTVPQRRFIPSPNQVFRPVIMNKINSAINEIRQSGDDLSDIERRILES